MHRLSAMAIQQQLRRNVINRALNTPRTYSSFYPKKQTKEVGAFHTSQPMRTSRDSSTVDFAYMPQHELEPPRSTDIMRMPILPQNDNTPARNNEALESVVRPEISTVSANGTHIDSPSSMHEVTDNHAIELSPFDLTDKVSNAATAAAVQMTGMSAERLKEPGVVQELWDGILDDILGSKKLVGKA